jgi:ABC-2 type transport system permease protein
VAALLDSGPRDREDPAPQRQPLSSWGETRLFWRLRAQIGRSIVRTALRTARLQVASVAIASTVLWIGLFVMFAGGFFLVQLNLVHPGLRAQLMQAIFNLFFLALTVMLVFSAAIILYGGLFRNDEVAHLLTTPAQAARIVGHKFAEAAFFSCWGFVLLASPMLLAYGIVVNAAWYYYVLLVPFILSFVLVPAGLGAILCLLVVRLIPTARVHALVTVVVLVVALSGFFGWRVLAYGNRDIMTPSWFQDVLARLQFSEQRLLPSWWLSSGLLEAAHSPDSPDAGAAWRESLLFLSVLVSNALLLNLLLDKVAAWGLRASYSSLQGLTRARRRAAVGWFDRAVLLLSRPLPSVTRHLIVKDLRIFRRDPVQWSQFAIFFGLLAFYFFNVRRFDYSGVMERWVVLISFFNLAVVGLLLSTFTTRFILPSISLEGRRFWVLGTAPIHRDTILWGKFWFACGGSLFPCMTLVLLSDLALRIPGRSALIVAVHQLTCVGLCCGLSAMSVGFGARLPNLRESSPSRIAAGFGGTLNLVLSSLYITGIVLCTAVPCLFWYGARTGWYWEGWGSGGRWELGSTHSVVVGVALMLLLSIVATVLPLRMGLRAFRRLEF